jgi:hypothetical protein
MQRSPELVRQSSALATQPDAADPPRPLSPSEEPDSLPLPNYRTQATIEQQEASRLLFPDGQTHSFSELTQEITRLAQTPYSADAHSPSCWNIFKNFSKKNLTFFLTILRYFFNFALDKVDEAFFLYTSIQAVVMWFLIDNVTTLNGLFRSPNDDRYPLRLYTFIVEESFPVLLNTIMKIPSLGNQAADLIQNTGANPEDWQVLHCPHGLIKSSEQVAMLTYDIFTGTYHFSRTPGNTVVINPAYHDIVKARNITAVIAVLAIILLINFFTKCKWKYPITSLLNGITDAVCCQRDNAEPGLDMSLIQLQQFLHILPKLKNPYPIEQALARYEPQTLHRDILNGIRIETHDDTNSIIIRAGLSQGITEAGCMLPSIEQIVKIFMQAHNRARDITDPQERIWLAAKHAAATTELCSYHYWYMLTDPIYTTLCKNRRENNIMQLRETDADANNPELTTCWDRNQCFIRRVYAYCIQETPSKWQWMSAVRELLGINHWLPSFRAGFWPTPKFDTILYLNAVGYCCWNNNDLATIIKFRGFFAAKCQEAQVEQREAPPPIWNCARRFRHREVGYLFRSTADANPLLPEPDQQLPRANASLGAEV